MPFGRSSNVWEERGKGNEELLLKGSAAYVKSSAALQPGKRRACW